MARAFAGTAVLSEAAAGAAEEPADDMPVDALLEGIRLVEANVQSGMSYRAAVRRGATRATVSMMAQRDSFKPPPTLADGAKLRWCTGCLVVRYCSVECSRAAWPAHKLRRLRSSKGGAREGTVTSSSTGHLHGECNWRIK